MTIYIFFLFCTQRKLKRPFSGWLSETFQATHAESECASFSFFTFAIWTITFTALHTFFSVKSCSSPWTAVCNKVVLAAFASANAAGKRGFGGGFPIYFRNKTKIENIECASKDVLEALSAKNGCQSKWTANWRGAVSHATFSIWGEKECHVFQGWSSPSSRKTDAKPGCLFRAVRENKPMDNMVGSSGSQSQRRGGGLRGQRKRKNIKNRAGNEM